MISNKIDSDGKQVFNHRGCAITLWCSVEGPLGEETTYWAYRIVHPHSIPTFGTFNTNYYTFQEALEKCRKNVNDHIEVERMRLKDAICEIENERRRKIQRKV